MPSYLPDCLIIGSMPAYEVNLLTLSNLDMLPISATNLAAIFSPIPGIDNNWTYKDSSLASLMIFSNISLASLSISSICIINDFIFR